ncbi:18057_t:CDS:2 [Funneliformis geosporum]|nr:18057_t:CDS:2 [Funneliformis geosporum]
MLLLQDSISNHIVISMARRIIVIDNDLTDLNIEWITTLPSNKEIVLTELWNWAKHTSSLPFENKTKLRIKKYHSKSDSVEKAHDFSNVEES